MHVCGGRTRTSTEIGHARLRRGKRTCLRGGAYPCGDGAHMGGEGAHACGSRACTHIYRGRARMPARRDVHILGGAHMPMERALQGCK